MFNSKCNFFFLSLSLQETFNSPNTEVCTGKVCQVPWHWACTDRPSPAVWRLWVAWHLFHWHILTLFQRKGSCSQTCSPISLYLPTSPNKMQSDNPLHYTLVLLIILEIKSLLCLFSDRNAQPDLPSFWRLCTSGVLSEMGCSWIS